jgi:acyl carrier protein
MNTAEFLGLLEEGLELPAGTLRVEDVLKESGYWDSMAALTFMALADQELGMSISGEQLKKCRTIRDLVDLLGDKIAV